MTLEQYEALLAEKKAELNKARVVRTIDASEFANLKVVNKDEEEEENPLEVRGRGCYSCCSAAAGCRCSRQVLAAYAGLCDTCQQVGQPASQHRWRGSVCCREDCLQPEAG